MLDPGLINILAPVSSSHGRLFTYNGRTIGYLCNGTANRLCAVSLLSRNGRKPEVEVARGHETAPMIAAFTLVTKLREAGYIHDDGSDDYNDQPKTV